MKDSRFRTVFAADFLYNLKRPFYWIWYIVLAWNAWLMSAGIWFIRSVDTAVGTEKSFVNSEFQIAFVLALMPVLILGIFIAIAAGTPLIRDEQQKVGELIHATPLKPWEYVWGKFFAFFASGFGVLFLFLLTLIFLNEVIPNPLSADIHGPFHLRNYLMPFLVFVMPVLILLGGVCFAIGEFTRKTFLVYLFPVAILLFYNIFFLSYYPADTGSNLTLFLQYIDPSGFRWLKQTWLVVDRGVPFYNTNPITYGAGFLASRLIFVAVGIGMVALSSLHFAKKYAVTRDRKIKVTTTTAATPLSTISLQEATVLPQTSRHSTGLVQQIGNVFRFEITELASQPWLFLFVVMISIFLVLPDRVGEGPLRLEQLYLSGLVASGRMLGLTTMTCFLLLFTNTESLYRETQTGLSALSYSSPVRTSAILIGKLAANFSIAIVAILASFLAAALMIVTNHEAPLEIQPFIQTWGYLMLPTFIFWSALVTACFSWTRSRMATYGVALLVLGVSGWAIVNDKMNWVTNWPLALTLRWSDFGSFDLDLKAYIWNRALYLSLAIALMAFAIFHFPRRTLDAKLERRTGSHPRLRLVATTFAFLALPVVFALYLWVLLQNGFQGSAEKEREKDYWRRNLASFMNEPLPYRTRIDLDLKFDPPSRSFHANGAYEMINRLEHPLYRIPLTGLGSWKNLKWTVNGKPFEPENRSRMFVFPMEPPLQSQQTITIGFTYDGTMLPGISRNGGELQLGEFILPAGIVLTGRNPWFVPVLGYVDSVGIDDKNRYEPKDPGPHYYEGITDAGIDRSLLQTKIRIDIPQEYTATSMGVRTKEEVRNGRRITLWESDYPVRVFNVVAGKWAAQAGKQSVIYYHPRHHFNVDTMLLGLDSARQYYSEWFGPYVWKELRMSEFPALSTYARGNPTNIFFSEGIGFLTKDATGQPAAFGLNAFGITAHESAHQWWGHMLSPGEGPGGIVLAEGMANFATLCLVEQVIGEEQRQTIARQMEAFYGENRAVSSERPLSQSVFFRPGDVTVIYDKGGWVFWMMKTLLGKKQMYEGLTSFIQKWHKGPDHPVLEDFVNHMRSYAPDPVAYDAFTRQWIFGVSMPEFRYMTKPEKIKSGSSWLIRTKMKNVGNADVHVDIAALGASNQRSIENLSFKAGEEKFVELHCDFDPQRLVVDPDVQLFQLQRNGASFRFK